MRILRFVLFAVSLVRLAQAGDRGVIDDPDGYVNVRADKSAEAAVIATVKPNEPFTFTCEAKSEWCSVTLASRKSGWMHLSRIRLFFTEKDLPERENEGSEIDDFARRRGFNYATVTRRAARGDVKALKQFFAMAKDVDGAAAESYAGMPTAVYHILGDEKFAKFLSAQPLAYRMMVRNSIAVEGLISPPSVYLPRHFPETTKVLFPAEIVAWPSPNERYAIRKIFSDAFDLRGSKVVRAEVIEKASGQVLCDLTRDDIGVGPDREGEILWSPDSKRFAYLSSDLSVRQGNLFSTPRPAPQRKLTAVYQMSGESFGRVELSPSEPPGRETDAELNGAILGHEYTEPVRWEKPDVLVLERHEYYEKLQPDAIGDIKFESIHTLARRYRVTATIAPDGKAAVVWKLRKDP